MNATTDHFDQPSGDEGVDTGTDVVTGAFSYSGGAIARLLIGSGRHVRTMTGHPQRAPKDSPIEAHPLDFGDHPGMVSSLTGATTLYNTYWVRFAHDHTDHDQAVANSSKLFDAAGAAGIRRIVHVSITHPNANSPFPYFRGKALVEQALARTGIPYAIVRPAILFGGDDVLLNNVAWLLRHVPVFAVGGTGGYRVRGIHVDDLARLCLDKAAERDNSVTDAVGPERPTFLDVVSSIRTAVGSRSLIVPLPGRLLPILSKVLGVFLHDVLLTSDEYRAMAAGLADTDSLASGTTALSTWLADHGDELGLHYANDLRRHF
jgi:NADH dehydrogenase